MAGKSIVVIVLAVAVVILLVLVSWYAMAAGGYVPWEPPNKDNNSPDPIIGYFALKATVHLDNRNWIGGARATLTDLTADVKQSASSLSFEKFLETLGVTATEWDLSVRFTITSPQNAEYWFVKTTTFKLYAPGGGDAWKDVSPNNAPGIKYAGSYHISAELLDVNGDVIDSKTINVEV